MQRDFGLLSIVLDNFDLWQATRYGGAYLAKTKFLDFSLRFLRAWPPDAIRMVRLLLNVLEHAFQMLLDQLSPRIDGPSISVSSTNSTEATSDKHANAGVMYLLCDALNVLGALVLIFVRSEDSIAKSTKIVIEAVDFSSEWACVDEKPVTSLAERRIEDARRALAFASWRYLTTLCQSQTLVEQLLTLAIGLLQCPGTSSNSRQYRVVTRYLHLVDVAISILQSRSHHISICSQLFEVLADIMTGSAVDTILIRPLIAVVDEVIYEHLSAYQQDATRRDVAVHCLRLLLALTTQCPQNARCLQKSSAQGIWLGLLPVVQADRSPVIATLFLRCVLELHPLAELEAFNEGAQLLLSVKEELRLSLFAEHWDSSSRDYVSRLVLHICHLVETPQVPACVAAVSLLISWCDDRTSGPLLFNDASSEAKIGVCLARLACHPATVEAVVDVLRSEAAYSARGQVLSAVRDQYGGIIDLPRQCQASLLQLLSAVTTATERDSNDPFDEITWGSISKVAVTLWTAKDAYCCDAVLSAFPQLSRYRRLDRMQDLARDLREICTDVLNHRVIGVDPSVCLRAVSVGTGVRQFIRSDPNDWSSPFVIFALPLSFTAASTAVSVLEILSRCLRDRSFRRELWGQIGLFEELFAALACHDARISG
ncbi:hypothetical protein P43SY_011809 [Pythium insidiosum]|uniref:Uncharacterized protein n=1 Tax=Pythium insidiosum TaxID=114742 RepID=A0AAD5Q1K1_PYTIN|nr:hypothetical protein P43SY_011809 [Pythium insidiosum]